MASYAKYLPINSLTGKRMTCFEGNFDVPTFAQLKGREVVALVKEHFADCYDSFGVRKPGRDGFTWTWMDAICSVEKECGYHPHLQYMKACWHSQLRSHVRSKLLKRAKHAENEERWFTGGREEAYFKKYPYGGHQAWFLRAMEKRTGMSCHYAEPVDLHVEDTSAEEATEFIRFVQDRPCVYCRRRNCGEICDWLCRPLEHVVEEHVPPTRSIMLLYKLRVWIRRLREYPARLVFAPVEPGLFELEDLPTRRIYRRPFLDERDFVDVPLDEPIEMLPQMEDERGEQLNVISTGNVVLTEENPSAPSIATTSIDMNWQNKCTSDLDQAFEYLTDRFTYFKTFKWNINNLQGTEIANVKQDLPCDFINTQLSTGNMAMFIPFKVHRYVATDMHIKIHINSNKFQSGQLQFSWQYMEKYDVAPLQTIYGRSQLPHVIVNAGSSNEATLIVPYKYINPYMPTRKRKGSLDKLYYGTLRCYVISPLAVGDNVDNECTFSIFIKFANTKFNGMIDGGIAEPEMMPVMAAMVASKAVDKLIGDSNCDNPTSRQVPNYLVPTASHSWSLGSGLVEPLHNLRLNADAIGVGRSGIDNSETVISVPARTFGMLQHIEWSANESTRNKAGTPLWSCDAHPQLEKSKVWKTADAGDGMATYQLPPVSVVSGLYQYWRGSLEFRFDLVCTQFHTGRLLIAYIPGAYEGMEVTLEQARNSPHAEFSLQDSASFTFIVPYIADKPWWWRKYAGPQRRADTKAPSRLYLFVLNELIHIKAITDVVRIIPYVRAGVDFEVSVPVQPAVGLSYTIRNIVPKIDCAYGLAGYNPIYITYDSAVFDSTKYCLQYSSVNAARFNDPLKLKPNEYAIYSLDSKETNYLRFKVGNTYLDCRFIILVDSGAGYSYALPFGLGDGAKARSAAKYWKEGNVEECKKLCYDYVEKGPELISTYNPCWIPKIYSDATPKKRKGVFEPEMEDRYQTTNLLQPTSSLSSTGFGNYTFNENFSDMKDLMRRYQLYATQIVKPVDQKKVFAGDAICRFPVIPTGLALDVNNPSPIWNSMREGAIPIVMNGYVFFRGSIRFRVILSSIYGSIPPSCIWVQHHPDMPLDDYTFKQGAAITNKDRFKNHNYAYYIQTLNINNIIEFEVPFYQPSMYGFLRRSNDANINTDLSDYLGLGDIIIGITNADVIKSLQLDIYYSIGDDFSISTFRGFDPVVFCNEVFPEMEDEYIEDCSLCLSFDCNCMNNSISTTSSFENIDFEPEMMASAFTTMLGSFMGTAASRVVTSNKDKVLQQARDFIKSEVDTAAGPHVEAVKQELNACKNIVDDKIVDWAKNQALLTAFGNLTHVLVSPTPKTVAVAIANILISFISGTVQVLTDLIGACTELFSRMWFRFTGEGVRGNAEPQSLEDEITPETRSIIAILFTGICGLVGVTCTEPKGYFPLMRNINMTATLSNNIITFLKNSSEAIASLIKYATSLLNPKAHLDFYLDQQLPTIKKWFDEVEYLCDARLKSRLTWDRRMCTRVFDAAHIGQLIVSKGIDRHLPGGKVLWDSYKKISDLRNDMVERGVHPDVRYEPFSFWFAGAAGIGKSHLTASFVNQLARSINYTSDTPLVFNITPGLKHWSGVQHPFALVSDDMFQVGGENLEQELANLFVIMSSCTLNPPMAAVEEKNKRLNPYIYVMHSNFEFPNLGNVMRCKEAVYRRRKLMVRVELASHIADAHPNFVDASELTPEELGAEGRYEYLTFRIAANPRDENTEWGQKLTYTQFLNVCKQRFIEHHQRETANFTRRMNSMYNLSPEYDPDNVFDHMPGMERRPTSLSEQIEVLRQRVNEIRMELNDPTRQVGYCEQIGEYIRRWFGNEPQSPDMEIVAYDPVRGILNSAEDVYNTLEAEASGARRHVVRHNIDHVRTCVVQIRQNLQCANLSECLYLWKSMVGISDEYFRSIVPELNCSSTELLDLMYYHVAAPNRIINGMNSTPCFPPITVRNFATYLNFVMPGTVTTQAFNWLSFGSVDVNVGVMGFNDYTEPPVRNFVINHKTLAEYLRMNLYVQMNANRRERFLEWCANEAEFGKKFGMRGEVLNIIYQQVKNLWKWGTGEGISEEDNMRLFDYLYPAAVMCPCGRALYETLIEPSNFEYDHYTNRLIHFDCFGIRRVMNLNPCNRQYCPLHSRLFRSLFRIIYNQANPTKHQIPFTFVSDPGEDFRREYPNWMEKAKSWWKVYISPALSYVVDFLLYMLPGILALAATFLAVKAYSYVNNNWSTWFKEAQCSPESNNYFKFDAPKAAPKIARPTIIPKFVSATPQSLQTARPVMANAITENMVVLSATWVERNERRIRNCTCLMLYGRKMLVLRHYMEEYTAILKQGVQPQFTLYFQTSSTQNSSTNDNP
ncbi:MAG: capsid protein [Hangzhou iflavirus 3]|nr:MAG: capsid protein [Hangzhou iflavirus 3]